MLIVLHRIGGAEIIKRLKQEINRHLAFHEIESRVFLTSFRAWN